MLWSHEFDIVKGGIHSRPTQLLRSSHFSSLEGDKQLFRGDEHGVGAVHGDGYIASWVTEWEVSGDVRDRVERHAHGGGALVEIENGVGPHQQHATWTGEK